MTAADSSARAVDVLGWLRSMVATSSRDWGQASGDALIYGVLVGWDCPPGVCDEAVEDAAHWCSRATAELAARHGWTTATVEKMRERREVLRALAASTSPPLCGAEDEETGHRCNQNRGHDGDHAAETATDLLARWPQEEES